MKEENTERAELITSLSRDKAAFDKRLDEMNTEMTEVSLGNMFMDFSSLLLTLTFKFVSLIKVMLCIYVCKPRIVLLFTTEIDEGRKGRCFG